MTDWNTLANVLQSIAGSLGTGLIIYITVALRKYLKTHSDQHEFLMKQTKENNTDIKRLLELQEKRETRTRRRNDAV